MATQASLSSSNNSVPSDKEDHAIESVHEETLATAVADAEKLYPWSRPLLELYSYCIIAFLCSAMNGWTSFLHSQSV